MDPKSRFLSKVKIRTSGCWEFTSSLTKKGYGEFWLYGKKVFAHRASWLLFVGKIPHDLDVCHSCDKPNCVNPEHLFTGTHTDNMRDMIKKGRKNVAIGKAHGSNTHPESILRRSRHPMAKLTQEQVNAIRKDSRSHRIIALDFKVCRSTISYIKSGKLWR